MRKESLKRFVALIAVVGMCASGITVEAKHYNEPENSEIDFVEYLEEKEDVSAPGGFSDDWELKTSTVYGDGVQLDNSTYNEKLYKVTDTITAKLDDEGTLTISGTGELPSFNSYDEIPWYGQRNYIYKLVISEGITAIGEANFIDTCIESASIASTVTKIGPGAFCDCYSLEEITGMKNVKNFGEYAFQNTAFAGFDFPEGTETIGNYLFCGSSTLKNITIPASATSIGAVAYKVKNLENITVAGGNPNYKSVDGVMYSKDGKRVIAYPAGKTEFKLIDGVTEMADYSASEILAQEVIVPGTVKTLGEGVFYGGREKTIVIADSVTSVGYFLCQDSYFLENAHVGTGLKEYGYRQFSGCLKLKHVDIGANIESMDYLAFADCASLEEVVIPSKVKYVQNGTFGNCFSLKQVSIPESVTEIWYQAFMNCTSLEEIKLPSKLETINRYSFWNTALKKVSIPSTVNYIGDHAFPSNTELYNIPPTLTLMEDGSYVYVIHADIMAKHNYEDAFLILEMVNEERAKLGVAPLTMDKSLLETAMMRADETSVLFSHDRPIGQNCFSANKKMYAENIAYAQSGAAAVNAWINSSGHYQNMINPEYRSIGVGVTLVDGKSYYVQCFGIEEAEAVGPGEYKSGQLISSIQFSKNNSQLEIKPNKEKLEGLAGNKLGDIELVFVNGGYTVSILKSSVKYEVTSGESCSVDEYGEVVGVKKGNSNIRISFNDDSSLYYDVKVNVYSNNEEPELPESDPSDPPAEPENGNSGYTFYIDEAGEIRCINNSTGHPVINEFVCDGTYTYYFQADGTAMRNRLTYHPDGIHVIYFDGNGHEVFSDFANVKQTIAGEKVNDYCFFDVYGYLYVDVMTYDKSGTYLYYANPYGVLEMNKWFQFSDTVVWADGTPCVGIAGQYGYATENGTLMTNQWTYDWQGRPCYMQGNGVALYQ